MVVYDGGGLVGSVWALLNVVPLKRGAGSEWLRRPRPEPDLEEFTEFLIP